MITTHVLDVSRGRPASGVPVLLEMRSEAGWEKLGLAETDGDGRVRQLGLPPAAGIYRITFQLEAYFQAQQVEGFYPEAAIVFHVRDAGQHYHVPLLLSPYGYSTYRGS